MGHKCGNIHLNNQWNEGGHNFSLFYISKVGRSPFILDEQLVLEIMWELHKKGKEDHQNELYSIEQVKSLSKNGSNWVEDVH